MRRESERRTRASRKGVEDDGAGMSPRVRFGLAAAIMAIGPFAALTAVVLVTAPGVFVLDAEVAAWWHQPAVEHPAYGTTLRVIGLATEPNWLRLIAFAGAVLLWRKRRHRAAVW